MDGDGRDPMAHAQLDAGEQVPVERMDAARPQEPDEVEGATRLPQPGAELDQRRKLVEFTGLDALGDADQVLGDHPSGPDVQVADLAVPHLAFGETHRQPAGLEQRARKAFPEPVPDGSGGQLDGVPLALAPVPPAVQNHEDNPVPGTSV